MAFLLLAANARDDMVLLLEKRREEIEIARYRATRRTAHSEDEDDQSCHSLPCHWTHRGSSNNNKSHNNNNRKPKSWKSYFSRRHHHNTSRKKNYKHKSFHDRLSWRQQRCVRQAAKDVQQAVEARLREAPFLASCRQEQEAQVDDKGRLSFHSDDASDTTTPVLFTRDQIHIRYWLGRGGFCDAWEVELQREEEEEEDDDNNDDDDDQKVVFKHLKCSLLPNHPSLFRKHLPLTHHFVLGAIDLRMEALYLSQISHPNIIHLQGVVQPMGGLPFGDGHYDGFGLLLEPLSDTLDQRLENWRRQAKADDDQDESFGAGEETSPVVSREHLAKVLDYASQMADALQFVHHHRIVLCDAKPTNIGFAKDDTVKLFDLGLCRELPADDNDDPHQLYTLPVGGTPIYLPPEALAQGRYNCLMDVYSWAMILYEMVSLNQPFGGLNREEHYQRVAKGGERPPLADLIPVPLHALLQHAWDADVKERWTMEQVGHELASIRQELGFLSASSTTPSSSSSHHHRRKSSNMDSLLFGRANSSTADQDDADSRDDLESCDDLESLEQAIMASTPVHHSMTADDFEHYFDDQPSRSSSGRKKQNSWSSLKLFRGLRQD